MEGNYDIFMGGQVVGKAEVRREGLYYCFRCRCDLTGEIMYRITVTVGQQEESLGIPVPEDGSFALSTRKSIKNFESGTPVFRVVPRHETLSEFFVPISPEEPFAYLARLKNACLAVRDNQTGIVIKN